VDDDAASNGDDQQDDREDQKHSRSLLGVDSPRALPAQALL
jgi:hypothetical protein